MVKFNIDKKQLIIIVLSLLLGFLSGYFIFRPTKKPLNYDEERIKKELNELKEKNKLLQSYVLYVEKQSFVLKCRVDSLQSLKSKIEIKYVSKFKEIDDASAIGVVNEFERIFSKSNFK
jgi:hypothetical protein